MNVEINDKSKQIIKMRTGVLRSEQERNNGVKSISVEEARRRLRERIDEIEE